MASLKIYALLLWLLLSCWTCNAEAHTAVVRRIDIQGHQAFSTRAILKRMSSREGQVLSQETLESDIQNVLRWYRDQGYLRVRVYSPQLEFNADSSQVNVTLHLEEGSSIRVGQIAIQGEGGLSQETLRGEMDLHPGAVFQGAFLEADLERILVAYENHGFPYSEIRVAGFEITPEDRLNFQLEVETGPQVRVESVITEGNSITRDYVIRRGLGIKEGDLYQQQAIERGRQRLRRLGFFQEVGEVQIEVGSQPDLAILKVPVVEGRTNIVDGVLGYQPATEARKGYFTGLLDLSFRNLLGTGRKVEAKWSRRDPTSSQLRFGYEEPWPLGLPITLGGSIEQINQDSSYAQTDLEGQVRAHLGGQLTAGVMFGWQRVIADLKGGQDLPNSRTYWVGLGLDLDARDDILGPRSGGRYQTAIRHRFKENQATESYQPAQVHVRSTDFTAALEHYLEIFRRHVMALSIHLGEIRSDEQVVPLNEQFKLGGARTLRGYREEQFHGSRVVWTNLEYRFHHGRRSWSFLFLDAGHYFYRRQDPRSDGLLEISGEKIGYGLGLRVESRLGIMGVDYGLGEGDGLTEGKVHFGLLNEF